MTKNVTVLPQTETPQINQEWTYIVTVESVKHSWNVASQNADGNASVVQRHPAAAGLLRAVAAEQVVTHGAEHAQLRVETQRHAPSGIKDTFHYPDQIQADFRTGIQFNLLRTSSRTLHWCRFVIAQIKTTAVEVNDIWLILNHHIVKTEQENKKRRFNFFYLFLKNATRNNSADMKRKITREDMNIQQISIISDDQLIGESLIILIKIIHLFSFDLTPMVDQQIKNGWRFHFLKNTK